MEEKWKTYSGYSMHLFTPAEVYEDSMDIWIYLLRKFKQRNLNSERPPTSESKQIMKQR